MYLFSYFQRTITIITTNYIFLTLMFLYSKAAITICFLYVVSWTPYGVMSMIGAFGNKALLTPGVTMIPACTCKAVACLDPYVYAISHPKYR